MKLEPDELLLSENEDPRKDVHLVLMGNGWTVGKFYGLSSRIEYDEWIKVNHLFKYYQKGWSDDMGIEWQGYEPYGWLTQDPAEVEKILQIREELTLEYIEKERLKEEMKRMEMLIQKDELKEKVISCFVENGERPLDVKLFELEGDVLEPSDCKWNIYGGGYKFIICDDVLWFIQNNGADGDDWSRNNVDTGGAGAIGWRISFDEDVARMIREYCRFKV